MFDFIIQLNYLVYRYLYSLKHNLRIIIIIIIIIILFFIIKIMVYVVIIVIVKQTEVSVYIRPGMTVSSPPYVLTLDINLWSSKFIKSSQNIYKNIDICVIN